MELWSIQRPLERCAHYYMFRHMGGGILESQDRYKTSETVYVLWHTYRHDDLRGDTPSTLDDMASSLVCHIFGYIGYKIERFLQNKISKLKEWATQVPEKTNSVIQNEHQRFSYHMNRCLSMIVWWMGTLNKLSDMYRKPFQWSHQRALIYCFN